MSFQQIGQYDSTFFYLKTAERFLTNHEDIIYAQNVNYLAYLSLKKEFGVTAEKYALESLTVLDKFRQNRQEMNGEGKKGRLYTERSKIKSDAHSVLSTYYYQKDLYNLAKQQLDTAWFYAIEPGVGKWTKRT